jgi:phosphatidylinositol alpha-1,6-mannosyltransferase
MERLNWHMADELAKVAEVRVIGPKGAAALAPAGLCVREVPLAPLWRFLVQSMLSAVRDALVWKPDVVVAGSGLTAPAAYAAARSCGAQAVAYVHGLDVAVSSAAYRSLWWPVLRRMDRVVANSRATASLCRGIGVSEAATAVVHPGVALPIAQADDDHIRQFRRKYDLGQRRLLLSVGRLTDRKGLLQFIAHALPRIAAETPDVLLAIVGDVPGNALRAHAQTPASILEAASKAGVSNCVRLLGLIPEADLLAAYRAAELHVFPIRDLPGDPEGFGMVAVEAAAHGLSTVAFATGGVVDAVAPGRSGYLVPAGDYDVFADVVIRELRVPSCDAAACASFAREFAWPAFGERIARQLGLTPHRSAAS